MSFFIILFGLKFAFFVDQQLEATMRAKEEEL